MDEPYIERGRLWYLDVQALPAELQEKLRRRAAADYETVRSAPEDDLRQLDSEIARLQGKIWEATLGHADAGYIRELHGLAANARARKREALRGRASATGARGRTMAVVAPIFGLLGVVVLAALGASAVLTVLVPLLLTVAIATPYLLSRRNPHTLTGAELAAIEQATRSLPVADEIRARALVSGQEEPRDAADLVAVAAHLVDVVTASTAWRSAYLQPHRAQFDVRAEVRQIAHSAARYDAMARRLAVAPTGDTRTAELARSAQDSAKRQLEMVWQTLCRRVDALREFAAHLAQLDLELHNADLARQALDMDDDLAELLASAVSNELATEQLRHMSEQTAGLTLAIRELVDQLHLDVQTLRALAPGDA
ncbi:hypothetical protein JK358_20540 [Nocardia sp. 2]|uniref:Uncharacterized protein n=1 Tax=Nocardia acididurans TaxID=2802282 RepID=A0ABS1M989_9NOCA|nr:hypothetical protein [Nocardia acididurans]MBL1076789.1 hypothetical protein [Nocardia acididurans]